jgi:hypothetical protein
MVSVALTVATAIFNRNHRIADVTLYILNADNTVQNLTEDIH